MASINDYLTQYQSLILSYAQSSSEASLYECSELGKSMAFQKLSSEDVITLHEKAVTALKDKLTKSQIISSFDLLSEVSVQQTLWLKREMELKALAQHEITQKERLERSLISSFPDILIKLSIDLDILDKNELFDDIFPGNSLDSADDLLGMFESEQDFMSLREYVYKTHKRSSVRTSLKRSSGESIPCEVTVVLIENASDKEEGFLCIIRDLSQQEETNSRLAVAQQMIHDVIEAMPLRIYWKDSNLKYLGCNNAYLNDINIESDTDLLHKTGQELPAAAQRFSDLDMEKQVMRLEVGHTRCERRIKTDNNTLDILQTVHPLKDLDGEVYGIICCYEDISKLKRQEKETARLEQQLKQSERLESIGRLAGGIAHDFNNMLSVILGYSQMIERIMPSRDQDRVLNYVERISSAALKAKLLTEKLLTFSRKQDIHLEPIDIHQHIKNTLVTYESIIGEDIVISLISNKPHWILADISQLDQVILNLLVNAKDSMDCRDRPFQKRIDITLHQFPSTSHVRLTIEDSGQGIPEEVQDKIFDPFFTTKTGVGTGLGLSTILGIVLQNNAEIAIDSKVGVGTKVIIDWPLTSAPIVSKQTEHFKLCSLANTAQSNRPIVCVVEDEKHVRELISSILNENGLQVHTFDSGDALFKELSNRAFEPDLLISDVVLADGENGLDLSEEFLRLYPSAQRILMSGYSDDILSQKDLSLDNLIYIAKPFVLEQFIEAVNSTIASQ